MSQCPAKIRPFPNNTELHCEVRHRKDRLTNDHAAVLRNYAYPGSETRISWQDSDRRTFTGDWVECPVQPCVLPANHRGEHAP